MAIMKYVRRRGRVQAGPLRRWVVRHCKIERFEACLGARQCVCEASRFRQGSRELGIHTQQADWLSEHCVGQHSLSQTHVKYTSACRQLVDTVSHCRARAQRDWHSRTYLPHRRRFAETEPLPMQIR